MAKIYCIMGKSASGKDTVYRELLKLLPSLRTYVMYTTRPKRDGELDKVSYNFTDESELSRWESEGKLIEKRIYETVMGPWTYATIDDGQLRPESFDYLMPATLESYQSLKRYYGDDRVADIYIELPDGERLKRALERENNQKNPHYDELCRRFLSDARDFSEEKLKEAGIHHRFQNDELRRCVEEIAEFIKTDLGDRA